MTTTTTTPNAIEITDSVEGLLRLLSIEEQVSPDLRCVVNEKYKLKV
jgi:hypothetical protein